MPVSVGISTTGCKGSTATSRISQRSINTSHPRKYELRSDTTLVEAVAAVGIALGSTEASKHSQVVPFRRASDEIVEAKMFNAKQMLGSRNLPEDLICCLATSTGEVA
jgi:hypothetical protein